MRTHNESRTRNTYSRARIVVLHAFHVVRMYRDSSVDRGVPIRNVMKFYFRLYKPSVLAGFCRVGFNRSNGVQLPLPELTSSAFMTNSGQTLLTLLGSKTQPVCHECKKWLPKDKPPKSALNNEDF